MIYFLLPVGNRKFAHWPRPGARAARRERERRRARFNRIHVLFSLSLYLSSSLSSVRKEYLEYRFPISRWPAGNLYAKLASAATHVQGGAHRSPRERERGMQEEEVEEREKRLYYHVVPAEICMRKRGNAITRRGSREKCRGTIFPPPPLPDYIRPFWPAIKLLRGNYFNELILSPSFFFFFFPLLDINSRSDAKGMNDFDWFFFFFFLGT